MRPTYEHKAVVPKCFKKTGADILNLSSVQFKIFTSNLIVQFQRLSAPISIHRFSPSSRVNLKRVSLEVIAQLDDSLFSVVLF